MYGNNVLVGICLGSSKFPEWLLNVRVKSNTDYRGVSMYLEGGVPLFRKRKA